MQATDQSAERQTRLHYIPLGRAVPDMVLGMPLVLTENGVVRFNLPAGHRLNQANLDQLKSRHAEIVCVEEPDTRSPAEREAAWEHAEKELDNIFQMADLNNPMVNNLRQAVLNYRRR